MTLQAVFSNNTSYLHDTLGNLFMERYAQRFNDSHKVVVPLAIIGSTRSVVEAVTKETKLTPARTYPCEYGYVHMEFENAKSEPLLMLTISTDQTEPFASKNRLSSATLVGQPDLVESIGKRLLDTYGQENAATVHWYFMTAQGPNSIAVELTHREAPIDEFYPWIGEGIESYMQRFLDDDANVLLMTGDPGTGKTTFIREFIHRHNLSTAISHDAHLMDMDSFFIQFMTGSHQLLVLEDADNLLRAREDGNHMMSKLLNTADGLVRTRKKIILSANITHLEAIDGALTRPGRCFDILRFRELTTKEASAAAAKAGVVAPTSPATLATLFKGSRIQTATLPRVGFGVASRTKAANA